MERRRLMPWVLIGSCGFQGTAANGDGPLSSGSDLAGVDFAGVDLAGVDPNATYTCQ